MDYPQLNRRLILEPPYQERTDLEVPSPSQFRLPVRVLQFGSGRFLRGFTDFFIDTANRQGVFNGRVAVVRSTSSSGRRSRLNAQDGLYTVCLRGVHKGRRVDRRRVVAAVHEEISARDEWVRVLEAASAPDLEVIVSNTTEVGIVYDPQDRLDASPPDSFPGKLTAVLYRRFQAFSGDEKKGVVVIPCELIDDNGEVLKGIVRQFVQRWSLEKEFLDWVDRACRFCSSLVDRIVTGYPDEREAARLTEELGYGDDMLVVAEVYGLWAVEGDEALARKLSFAEVNPEIRIASDITPFRERKVRILNGTHTITVPAAFLMGLETVREAVTHPLFSQFMEETMRREIGPSLDVDPETVPPFIDEVLDRFRNPDIEHLLINITFQSTSKMRLRILPTLRRHFEKMGKPPDRMCFGFACWLLFLRTTEENQGKGVGRREAGAYTVEDDHVGYFAQAWKGVDPDDEEAVLRLVRKVCSETSLWETDLDSLPGFSRRVAEHLTRVHSLGVEKALRRLKVSPES